LWLDVEDGIPAAAEESANQQISAVGFEQGKG